MADEQELERAELEAAELEARTAESAAAELDAASAMGTRYRDPGGIVFEPVSVEDLTRDEIAEAIRNRQDSADIGFVRYDDGTVGLITALKWYMLDAQEVE